MSQVSVEVDVPPALTPVASLTPTTTVITSDDYGLELDVTVLGWAAGYLVVVLPSNMLFPST